jgi:hypothetical protein
VKHLVWNKKKLFLFYKIHQDDTFLVFDLDEISGMALELKAGFWNGKVDFMKARYNCISKT